MQPKKSLGGNRGIFQRRFIRTLSIGVKLWITTAVLALPLIGLGIFYVKSLSATVWFTSAEQQGAVLFEPVLNISRAMGKHGELQILALTSADSANPAQVREIQMKIDADLARLQELDRKNGNDATHKRLLDLNSKWAAIKSGSPTTAEDIIAEHSAAVDAAFGLKDQIGADWLLILDPELAAYDLIDTSLMKLPDLQRYFSEIQMQLASLSNASATVPMAKSYRMTELKALLRDRLNAANAELQGAADAAQDRPALTKQIDAIPREWSTAVEAWMTRLSTELASGQSSPARLRTLLTEADRLGLTIDVAQDSTLAAANASLAMRYDSQSRNAVLALTGSAIAMVVATLLMLALSKRVSGAVVRLLNISQRIAEGQYDSRIDESGRDEISKLFAGMASMQRRLSTQISEERHQRIENGRIRAALDNVSGCVMVANADREIIYTNQAMDCLLRQHEGVFSQELREFRGASVRGQSFDHFHANLLHQSSGQHTAQFAIGALTFRLIANPVVAENGERIGTVIEWSDRTLEVSVESETEQMLKGVLEGDLTHRIDVAGKAGFFATLARGMNQLSENIQQIVATTKGAAREVERGANEIAQGNANLSERTEQQSSSLEKTASSMQQMTLSVKQNADNAELADRLSTAACEQAQSGGALVGNVVRAMNEISDSSKGVANIISVIDEIAFQTNLLALNAAVEAARAGEQGRGFAVVASEVRGLAGRAAGSAKEIRDLIQASLSKVAEGSQLVAQSGQTLDHIVTSVRKVSDVVAEIASSSRAQTSGIEQVNRAVAEMDEMTQQNAALVEQATAASQAMAEQSRQLSEMLDRYRVLETSAQRTAPSRSQPFVRTEAA